MDVDAPWSTQEYGNLRIMEDSRRTESRAGPKKGADLRLGSLELQIRFRGDFAFLGDMILYG